MPALSGSVVASGPDGSTAVEGGVGLGVERASGLGSPVQPALSSTAAATAARLLGGRIWRTYVRVSVVGRSVPP
jgi:hypothetical protein